MALAKPATAYGGFERYPSLEAKAAALLYVLTKSQACIEGNKRVALLLVVAFLRLNDVGLRVQRQELADMILQVEGTDPSDHDAVIDNLTRWFAERIEDGA
jgi:death-on-curing protein